MLLNCIDENSGSIVHTPRNDTSKKVHIFVRGKTFLLMRKFYIYANAVNSCVIISVLQMLVHRSKKSV